MYLCFLRDPLLIFLWRESNRSRNWNWLWPHLQFPCEVGEKNRVLRHVVCFKFKDTAKASEVAVVVKAFAALEKKIAAIKDFEMGTNNSPEGLDKGFTHCFVVTFADEQGRKEYLPHPEHKKFVELLKPILDDVFVIDYWAAAD